MPAILNSTQIIELNKLLDLVAERQRQDFGHIASDTKPDGTLITDCDRWSDKTLVDGLQRITNNEEGVLSEEGCQKVPKSKAFWVVDPLDGTTNFSAGIPHWAISVARFIDGKPQSAFLDIPALQQRIFAVRNQGVWLNGTQLDLAKKSNSNSGCISICSRSIPMLQRKSNQRFPGKLRLMGVASLNLVGVAIGQTFGAIEATPKIWDLGSAWLILKELQCPIKWLKADPGNIESGQELSQASFPVVTASSSEKLELLLPWAQAVIENQSFSQRP